MALTANILYQTLYYSVSSTAADGWATDVGAGIDRKLAFYKWLAYESFRNGTTATFYPTQVAANVPAGKTYATLTSCEQIDVNEAVWAALGAGEQAYGTGAVSGMWGLVQAEMTDAVAVDQTTLSMTLRSGTGTETSASNFKAGVGSGMLLRQAFYRWLAKESVKEMASAATLIQQSVGEFYIKVTNPNDYDISIDKVNLFFRVAAVGSANEQVDAARQVVENVLIPANDEVVLKVLASTKTMDVIIWLVTDGKATTASALATEVWTKIQADTATWTVYAEATYSHDSDIQYQLYTLTIA
jgi:hypothetical protein